jgi:hypothetical protein
MVYWSSKSCMGSTRILVIAPCVEQQYFVEKKRIEIETGSVAFYKGCRQIGIKLAF